MVNNFDTSYAVTVSKIMETIISTYAEAPNTVLNRIKKIVVSYGQKHLMRPIADPYQDVHLEAKFKRVNQEASKLVQDLDLFTIFKSLEIDDEDMAGDISNAMMHVFAMNKIFRDGIESIFIEGSDQPGKIIYGVADYPNGTAGTVNRPEMAGIVATAGDWSTTSNMRTDLINAKVALLAKRFNGYPILLAPTICEPMFAEVITNTSTDQGNWIKNSLGIDTIFNKSVHEGATKDDFNCYLIDSEKVNLVLSEIRGISDYISDRHAQIWDLEGKITVAFDPLFDGTEYLKGVVQLDARDWSD